MRSDFPGCALQNNVPSAAGLLANWQKLIRNFDGMALFRNVREVAMKCLTVGECPNVSIGPT
jgi:hypothetical protein